jgi:putative transposase
LQEEKTAQKKVAMKEMMCDYLKNNDISIKDGANVNSIM